MTSHLPIAGFKIYTKARRLSAWSLLAVAVMVLGATAGPRLIAQTGDDAYAQAMAKGQAALKTKAWDPAIVAFKQANSLHNKTSADALLGLCRGYYGAGAFKSATDACGDALKYAGDNKTLEAQIHNQRGLVFLTAADQAKASNHTGDFNKALTDAEAEFRATQALTDTIPLASYNLALSLYRQNRDADGTHEMQAFIARAPRVPELAEAKRMVENPRRARENYAPDFSITTETGEYISLDDLKGNTVLIDFWGVWCPHCVEATPHLVEMYRKYSADPQFVMLGIDNGDKEATYRDYVAAHKMTWPEFFDKSDKIVRAFDVHSFPTYLVLNGEGIIVDRTSGFASGGDWSASTVQWIEQTIKLAKRSAPKGPSALLESPR